jgi:hypothetical protein
VIQASRYGKVTKAGLAVVFLMVYAILVAQATPAVAGDKNKSAPVAPADTGKKSVQPAKKAETPLRSKGKGKEIQEKHDFRARGYAQLSPHERETWQHGRWRHESFNGRFGWWYVADGKWYFYEEPEYTNGALSYPLIVSSVVFAREGEVAGQQQLASEALVMTEAPKMVSKVEIPKMERTDIDPYLGEKIAMAQKEAAIKEYEGNRDKLIKEFTNTFINIRCGLVTIDAGERNTTYTRGPSSYTTSEDGRIIKASLYKEESDDTQFFRWFVTEISNRAGTIPAASFYSYKGAEAAQCFLSQTRDNLKEYASLFSRANELGEKTSR